MRAQNKPASLGELMGSASSTQSNLGLKDLPTILGEKMPDLPKNRIGKFRLVNALQQRFGPGFRNIPHVNNIIKEFDQHVSDENVIKANKKGRI